MVILNATPMLMHSFSTQQLNLHYLQEDSIMDRYLTELKIIFFLSLIHFSYGFLFAFVYSLFCRLLFVLICVFNFLHLVWLAVSSVVINFLFTFS